MEHMPSNVTRISIFEGVRALQANLTACIVSRVGEEGIIIIHSLGRFWARIQGPDYVKVLYFPTANALVSWWWDTYERSA